MKLIKPSYEILEQSPGLKGIYKAIEVAGRTCYKSLDKITEDSAEDFVNRMIASKHYAMLEHGTIYLKVPIGKKFRDGGFSNPEPHPYTRNLYYKVYSDGAYHYITTNYRYIIENKFEHWLKFLCEPTEHHEKRVTVRFTTSNGIMREFTRHRSHSFAVESTRYCNYSKDKFDNGQVTFIIPYWAADIREGMYEVYDPFKYSYYPDEYTDISCKFDTDSDGNANNVQDELIQSLKEAEFRYRRLIQSRCKPQEAREVLPLATKCDMIMTGFVSDWQHFFRLRTSIIAETGKPHPDASSLADPLYKEFISRGYMEPLV